MPDSPTPIRPAKPGEPADTFHAALDEHSRQMRYAIINAVEQMFIATMAASIQAGIITDDQATRIMIIARGDDD